MTYWNETHDTHVRFWDTEMYPSYHRISHEFSHEGFRCDDLQPSEVLFVGTCDVMSNLPDDKDRWVSRVHYERHSDQPFIALGSVATGLPTVVRRLYSYIKNYGSPRTVYMTVPRFDSYEFVNSSGFCYNLSTRGHSADFCKKANLITEEEHAVWREQLAANKRLSNPHNLRYMLEERFAFIETICLCYNIDLRWTFNPSDAGTVMLHRNVSIFADLSPFMKKAFVGVPVLKDHVWDRSIGAETHAEIADKFLSPEKWDYSKLRDVAAQNFVWVENKYNNELIRGEE